MVCGGPQFVPDVFDTLVNPQVIIEILPEGTEPYDRGKKFHHYRKLPSLQAYIIVLGRAVGYRHGVAQP